MRDCICMFVQLDIAFRQRDEDDNPIRQGPEEIARAIGAIDVSRAQKLLKSAMKAIPLAADYDPIDVIYDDEHIIGLNKPPFVITAPKHRYIGGSLVNRVIGNMGIEPLVVHRLDMNTTGVVIFAKSSKAASLLHKQFREKIPQKTYLALVLGTPDWTTTTVDAPIGESAIEKYVYILIYAMEGYLAQNSCLDCLLAGLPEQSQRMANQLSRISKSLPRHSMPILAPTNLHRA